MSAVLQQAQDDALGEILGWVQEVVEGRGDSIAQMIVTTVLGCIPFVGQAVDAYNILRAIWLLTRNPRDSEGWMALVLSLIALVPGFGDALKNVFIALRNGKQIGRVLDSLPRHVRGDIETWFRTLDWKGYAAELRRYADNILGALTEVLDRHVTQWVMGRDGVKRLIRRLDEIRQLAQTQIDEVVETLQRAHQQALGQPLPATAAHVPAAPKARRQRMPKSEAPGTVQTTTAGTATPRSGQATATQRQSQPSKHKPAQTSASGEHITDYYFVKRNRSRSKINHRGVLWEMQQPGHHGIDHVWHGSRLPHGYRISDTKGTAKAFHKLETAKAVFQGLNYGIDAWLGDEDETRVRNAVGNTVGDGKQLSHRWVAKKIEDAQLTDPHRLTLIRAIKAWEGNEFKLGAETDLETDQRELVKCPYDRSLITVVGPNHTKHDNAKGPVAGRCCKPAASHQISTEFVLPNSMLRE